MDTRHLCKMGQSPTASIAPYLLFIMTRSARCVNALTSGQTDDETKTIMELENFCHKQATPRHATPRRRKTFDFVVSASASSAEWIGFFAPRPFILFHFISFYFISFHFISSFRYIIFFIRVSVDGRDNKFELRAVCCNFLSRVDSLAPLGIRVTRIEKKKIDECWNTFGSLLLPSSKDNVNNKKLIIYDK